MIKAEWSNKDNLSIETTGCNSKAVLVIDMPENCFNCPFYDNDCPFVYIYPLSGRHKDCPLRPLPQKRDECYYFGELAKNEFAVGYNTCLDDITGETE